MSALRKRPLAAFSGSVLAQRTSVSRSRRRSIGYQDLAAYLARQPGVSERWRDHLIASPFGTIHAATFSFSRPIGTTFGADRRAAVNFDPRSLDVKVWSGNGSSSLVRPALQVAYPRSTAASRAIACRQETRRSRAERKLAAVAADERARHHRPAPAPPPRRKLRSAAEKRRAAEPAELRRRRSLRNLPTGGARATT